MRLGSLVGAFAFAGALSLAACGAWAQDAPDPADGAAVVIYTHRFDPQDFEKGLAIVRDGFTAAQIAAGQTRRNYFLVDPEASEVVVVSFFGEGESVEAWHESMQRGDVLEQLEPLRREPLILQRYELNATTTTP